MSEQEKREAGEMAELMAQAQRKAQEGTALYVKGCVHGAQMAIEAMQREMHSEARRAAEAEGAGC